MQNGIDYAIDVSEYWNGILIHFKPEYHGYIESERETIIRCGFEAAVIGGYVNNNNIFNAVSKYLVANSDNADDDPYGLSLMERVSMAVERLESYAYDYMSDALEACVSETYDAWSITLNHIDACNFIEVNLDGEYGRAISTISRY